MKIDFKKVKLKRKKKIKFKKTKQNKIKKGERGGASYKNNKALFQKERRIEKLYYK